jgi:hypothetical protein
MVISVNMRPYSALSTATLEFGVLIGTEQGNCA